MLWLSNVKFDVLLIHLYTPLRSADNFLKLKYEMKSFNPFCSCVIVTWFVSLMCRNLLALSILIHLISGISWQKVTGQEIFSTHCLEAV